jgi:uncharacterized membrane protein
MSTSARVALLVVAIALIFATIALVLLQVLPGPHRSQDYFVVGAVATMVSMVILFIVLITGWVKNPDVFFKRKKKEPSGG